MFSRKKNRRPTIDIVPMIDVMFFMLIFFMFFTTFKTEVTGIPLELPKSKEATNIEERVVVSVNAEENVFYGSQQVTTAELTAILRPLAVDPNLLVVINADASVKYGKIIEVMEAITEAGVSIPALGVEKRKD